MNTLQRVFINNKIDSWLNSEPKVPRRCFFHCSIGTAQVGASVAAPFDSLFEWSSLRSLCDPMPVTRFKFICECLPGHRLWCSSHPFKYHSRPAGTPPFRLCLETCLATGMKVCLYFVPSLFVLCPILSPRIYIYIHVITPCQPSPCQPDAGTMTLSNTNCGRCSLRKIVYTSPSLIAPTPWLLLSLCLPKHYIAMMYQYLEGSAKMQRPYPPLAHIVLIVSSVHVWSRFLSFQWVGLWSTAKELLRCQPGPKAHCQKSILFHNRNVHCV